METIEALQKEIGITGIELLEKNQLLMKVQMAMLFYCADHIQPKYSIVRDGPIKQDIVIEKIELKQNTVKEVDTHQPPLLEDKKRQKFGGRKKGSKNKPKPEVVDEVAEVKEDKSWPNGVYHNVGPGRPKKIKPVIDEKPPEIKLPEPSTTYFDDDLDDDEPVKKEKRGWPPLVITDPDRIKKEDIAHLSDNTEGKVPFRVNERTIIYVKPGLTAAEKNKLKEKYRLDIDMVGVTSNGNSDGKEFVSTFNK